MNEQIPQRDPTPDQDQHIDEGSESLQHNSRYLDRHVELGGIPEDDPKYDELYDDNGDPIDDEEMEESEEA